MRQLSRVLTNAIHLRVLELEENFLSQVKGSTHRGEIEKMAHAPMWDDLYSLFDDWLDDKADL